MDPSIDYAELTLRELHTLASRRGCADEAKKMNKRELVQLMQNYDEIQKSMDDVNDDRMDVATDTTDTTDVTKERKDEKSEQIEKNEEGVVGDLSEEEYEQLVKSGYANTPLTEFVRPTSTSTSTQTCWDHSNLSNQREQREQRDNVRPPIPRQTMRLVGDFEPNDEDDEFERLPVEMLTQLQEQPYDVDQDEVQQGVGEGEEIDPNTGLPIGYDPADFDSDLPPDYNPADFDTDLPEDYNPADFEDVVTTATQPIATTTATRMVPPVPIVPSVPSVPSVSTPFQYNMADFDFEDGGEGNNTANEDGWQMYNPALFQ